MFDRLRTALSRPSGLAMVLPLLAIGWGLTRLQTLVEQTQAQIEANEDTIAEQTAALVDLAKARHPVNHPTAEDVDPLDRAAVVEPFERAGA